MTYENNPIELGLDRLIDWDLENDAVISMAALLSIQEHGVERRINGLEMDGDPFPELNNVKWPIVDGGREIGKVTSAIYSPRLERNIGFAWLPVERSTLGERVTVETEWGARAGTVVEMPFVDPSKQIPVS
jgi:aminomethyltransferase